ncbi:MAG TPA: thioredoxin-dependent thiol peroxidase [Ktedonobacterales bacterium]|nr:thioredoxin-dependent thiol peroxidase [Ktedonobacterales bacterium]
MTADTTSGVPTAGTPAPDFTLAAGDGSTVTLSALRGQWVVLYFYPKDDTPGCTIEACSFRDSWHTLEQRGVRVLGISRDSVKSHQKFAEKYGLPFTLLADEDTEVAQKYGVWVERSMYGKKFMGTARTTFAIGPDGVIQHVWEKVNPEGHAAEVLAFLEGKASA